MRHEHEMELNERDFKGAGQIHTTYLGTSSSDGKKTVAKSKFGKTSSLTTAQNPETTRLLPLHIGIMRYPGRHLPQPHFLPPKFPSPQGFLHVTSL